MFTQSLRNVLFSSADAGCLFLKCRMMGRRRRGRSCLWPDLILTDLTYLRCWITAWSEYPEQACCICLVCLLWENHSTLDPCLMKVLVMNLVFLCFLLDCCTYTYRITFLQIVVIPEHFPLQVNFCFPLHWKKCCIFSHLSTDFGFHHIYANCTDTFF